MPCIKSTIVKILLSALLLSAVANASDQMFADTLSEEITSFCDAFTEDNVKIYCVQAQFSAYAHLRMLISKNQNNQQFIQLYSKCHEKYSNIDAFSKEDYSMTYACINHNSTRLKLDFRQ